MHVKIPAPEFEDIDIEIKQNSVDKQRFGLYITRKLKANTHLFIEHRQTPCKKCGDDFVVFLRKIPYCIACENTREDLQEELANKNS